MKFEEYILGLFTIISGLAVTEIALRLGRLLAHRRTVRWDWLPFLSCAVVILTLVINWSFTWYAVSAPGYRVTFFGFLVSLLSNLLLYLVAAACLPQDPDEGFDLRAFYERQGGEFWALFAIFAGQWTLRHFVPLALGQGLGPLDLLGLGVTLVSLVIAIALARWRDRRLHAIGALIIIGLILAPNLIFHR